MEDVYSPETSVLTDSLESTRTTCLYDTFISLHPHVGHGVNKNLTESCQMSSVGTRFEGLFEG